MLMFCVNICENDNDGFWKGVSKINQTSNVIASSMMVYQVNVIFQCSGEIISALY